jgi:hypothetical protein
MIESTSNQRKMLDYDSCACTEIHQGYYTRGIHEESGKQLPALKTQNETYEYLSGYPEIQRCRLTLSGDWLAQTHGERVRIQIRVDRTGRA